MAALKYVCVVLRRPYLYFAIIYFQSAPCSPDNTVYFTIGMKTLMPTTPLTSFSTCTPRRAKASSTAARMFSVTCSRSVFSSVWSEKWKTGCTVCYSAADDKPCLSFIPTGWHSDSLRQKLWHKDGRQVCLVADWETQGMLQTWCVNQKSAVVLKKFEQAVWRSTFTLRAVTMWLWEEHKSNCLNQKIIIGINTRNTLWKITGLQHLHFRSCINLIAELLLELGCFLHFCKIYL